MNSASAQACFDRGKALIDEGRFEDAVPEFQQARSEDPRFTSAVLSLGYCLQMLARYDEALQCYDAILSRERGSAQAHFGRATVLLRMGRYPEGWPEYEWRLRLVDATKGIIDQAPLWRGERAEGKTIFVHSEQGLGDAIQFARFLPWVRERCARVVLLSQSALTKLFCQNRVADAVVERFVSGPEGEPDLYVPLGSLPGLFNTAVDAIPAPATYLQADPADAAAWRAKMDDRGVRVGLVWAVGIGIKRRSCPLGKMLKPLAQVPGVIYYSLQVGSDWMSTEEESVRGTLRDLMSENRDLADTAAAIANLDLVISVDTSVAHLAASMGKPTWIVLPHVPDWRWLLDRESSPWYPTVRLFRQRRRGDWDELFPRVAAALRAEIASIRTT